VQLLNNVTI